MEVNFSTFLKLVKLLRLDLFVFLYMFAIRLPNVTRSQLIQDKYCINQLQLEPEKCLNIESLGLEYEDFKNEILKFSNQLVNYDTLITAPIGIVTTLLVGCWIDRYPGHLRYLLAVPALGGCLSEIPDILGVYYFQASSYHLLWRSIINASTGTMATVLTGSYAYVSFRTKSKYRVARFAAFELSIAIASIFSTAIGGKLLTVTTSFYAHQQYRNYYLVFLTSMVFYAAACVWVLIVLNDAGKREEDEDKHESICSTEKTSDGDLNNNGKDKSFFQHITEVLRPSSIVSMLKIFLRPRPQKRRKVLLHLSLGMCIGFLAYLSEFAIGFQFAQKVYHWDASYYSYSFSLMTIIPAAVTTFVPILLARKALVFDSTLCIIGSISMILSLIVKGCLLEPAGYFIASILGTFSSLLLIVKRSIVSRIIDENETGQIFSLLASIEGTMPLIISVFYTSIFNLTIDSSPGTAHQIVAVLMFYPYLLSLWLGLNVYHWDPAAIKFREEKLAKLKLNVN